MTGRTRRFYDRQYARHRYATGTKGRPETDELRRFIRRHDLRRKRVLELGCGRGAFKDLADDWIGVDLSWAAGRAMDRPFVAASAEDLPFRDGSVDAVWSVTVLEHVAEPERALEEVARVLRPGGVAYLAPAWHCRPWAADGYHVRPWSDFGAWGKLVKATVPLREALWYRAAKVLPWRLLRALWHALRPSRPVQFRFRRLKANYDVFWTADSDACCSMDPHEMLLWFRSRGWATPRHASWWSRFSVRHGAVVVQKPHRRSGMEHGTGDAVTAGHWKREDA